jgi:hypothetical protein
MKTSLIAIVTRFVRRPFPPAIAAFSFITSALAADVCTPPPPNMVASWRAEWSAHNAENASNSGILQGGVTFMPGKVGYAFTLDGTGAVNIPNQGSEGPLNFQGSDFTVDAWVRLTGNGRVIFQNYSGVSYYQLSIAANQYAAFSLRDFDGNGITVIGTRTLNDGLWHHIAGVREGSTARIYVDGVEENNTTNQIVGGVQIICQYAHIGGGNSGPDNCYEAFADEAFFTGQIDEVDLFRRALTPTEVADIYNAGSAGKCRTCTPPPPNMVSWWTGDGNPNDSSGSNYNGTLSGDVALTVGEVDEAFTFSGTNGEVILPNSASAPLLNFFT